MMKSIGEDEHGNDIKVRDSEGIHIPCSRLTAVKTGTMTSKETSSTGR